ncbi:MAG: amidohydrolase family protein [Bacteroidales bacterium]|nr:amidohydrolase family protein [Bacteroidales bacterium]
MQRFSSNYIFPIHGGPIKNGVICLDNNNTIVEIIDPEGCVKELASMEFHNGVIVPGFINTHCHLELSHLKGKFEKSNGIADFVSQIRNNRKADELEIANGIKSAISSLKSNGVVAVGDICNTSHTIYQKQESDILFHNFIELFGLNPVDSLDRFNSSLALLNEFKSVDCGKSTLTPHSTYSISAKLWEFIKNELNKNRSIVSIHYGESLQEYAFLKDHSGLLAENFKNLGISINLPKFNSPCEVVKQFIPTDSKVLFVHNTFASNVEIKYLASHYKKSIFVLCPSSNLFIESILPDAPMIASTGVDIALGTDSYASTDTISVFDQMMILLEKFPTLSFNEVLKWATLNGAKALSLESKVGSLEVGKKPGLNLITNFDFSLMRPTKKSKVKRLA